MPIDRTEFNAWIDDDGSGTTGTVLDKATIAGDLLDPIDEAIAAAELAGILAAPIAHHTSHETGGTDPIAAIAPTVITPLTGPAVVGRETGTGAAQSLALGAGLVVASGTVSATARASGVFNYVFNSTDLTEPPNDQRIRFNAGSPYTGVTKVWADFDSTDSQDLYFGWMRITVGSTLLVQDKDNHNQYAEFTVTAAPIDKGTYVELGVAHAAHGSTPLATQAVLVRITTAAVPLAHHTTHETGGADAIAALAGEVITSGTVAAARVAAGAGRLTVVSDTSTGTVNDWAPGLSGNTVILWGGVADLTVTGIAGGVAGQRITIRNVAGGAAIAWFPNNSGSSLTANRFKNLVTTGNTPIANRGWISYVHDGTEWKIDAHEQGDWITHTFNAAEFTGNGSMTWTVAAGDVESYRYRVSGRSLQVAIGIVTSTVGGTLNTTLNMPIPGGYTNAAFNCRGSITGLQGANVGYSGSFLIAASGTTIAIRNTGGQAVNWTASTDLTAVYMNATIPLT